MFTGVWLQNVKNGNQGGLYTDGRVLFLKK
jgi:hypothetical protein